MSGIGEFFKSDNGQVTIFVIVLVIVLSLVIGLSIFLWRRALSNGATASQVFVGKKVGELCTSDAMCGTNKCRSGFCVI